MKLKELRLHKDEIIKKYCNGTEVEELKKYYSANWTDIYDIISTTFEHSFSKISEQDKNKIVKMYNEGMSTTKIGEKLKIYHKAVARVLEKNNIKRVNNGKRKYSINEQYFDNIDTPNKAYILGFLYADGCNIPNKRTITLSLYEKDYEILEKIRLEIGSEKPLVFVKQSERKDKDNDYHYSDMYSLRLFSSHYCKKLNELGVTPRKSLTLEFPKWINKNLLSHFIRGYFDGDGSIHCDKKTNGHTITFVSTKNFCEELIKIIRENVEGVGGGIYNASNNNGITKYVSFSGNNQVEKILNWLYKDAELYMQRKYERYVNLCNRKKHVNKSQSE